MIKSRFVIMLTLVLGGCSVDEPGWKLTRSVADSAEAVNAQALSAFQSANYRQAAELWSQGESSFPPDGSADELNSASFIDKARFRAASGWALVSAGDVQAGKLRLDESFSGLQLAEQRFSQVRDIQAAQGAVNFRALSGAFQQGLQRQANFVSIGQVFTGMFTNDQAPPIQVDVVGKEPLQTDGVRFAAFPTIGIPMLIGQLRRGPTNGWCTASLVGYRVAITAAHCVVETNNGKPMPASALSLRFPSLVYADEVKVSRVVTHEPDGSWLAGDNHDTPEYQNDWAVLYLDRHPTGRGWFGVSTAASSAGHMTGELAEIGFSQDLNEQRYMQVTWGCSGGKLPGLDILQHRCASWHGNSGSPVFQISTNQNTPSLISMNTYGFSKASQGGGGPIAASFIEAIMQARSEFDGR